MKKFLTLLLAISVIFAICLLAGCEHDDCNFEGYGVVKDKNFEIFTYHYGDDWWGWTEVNTDFYFIVEYESTTSESGVHTHTVRKSVNEADYHKYVVGDRIYFNPDNFGKIEYWK